ncbi:MlaD family protein [Haloechinothrix salitolerans]|uniref:MlaD family protein n=1 Tax=Haloechinothrix salitolerans TaxID=926830 RepID=A0ABW2C1G1_9PSEU
MGKPVHRRDARKFLFGLGVLTVLTVIGLIGAQVQGGGVLPGKSYTYVQAAFDDVGTLDTRQDVTHNGVRVGTVSDIEFVAGRAVVTLRLEGDRDVYRDASVGLATKRVRIGNESALGRRYVEFDPGTQGSGPLGDQVIASSQTRNSGAVNDLFVAFDTKTRTKLATGLRNLGGGLAGHSGDLNDVVKAAPDLLDNLGQISGALTAPDADVSGLLRDANQLASRFADRENELRSLLRQTDTTLRAITVDGGEPLRQTVGKLPGTLRTARAGLSDLNDPLADIRSTMNTVQPGTRALGRATEDLRGVFREAPTPLRKLPGVSDKSKPAVDELTKTFADARPLAPQLARTVSDANTLLDDVAPYSVDIGMFFASHDLLSGRIAPGKHYFSAMVASPGLYNVSVDDPLGPGTDYYPRPGGGGWANTPPSERPDSIGER